MTTRLTVTDEELSLPAHSPNYDVYFRSLNKEIETIYAIAEKARSMGFDPQTKVEIPPAHDVAARVEATLEGPVGVAKRIRELQLSLSREEVAFQVAKEIAIGELGGIDDREKAADKAVRVALSILTESITAAPLEGIAKVRIRGSGNEQYLALYLAGPIRAAGGTEAAVTVLVADYVRQVLELPPLKSTPEEVDRAFEEVELYSRAVHLQYPIHEELIRFAAEHLPIMLTGEPTEEFEVSGTRDLPRIETNRVRGGAVLVLNDGVVGRAAKLARIVDRVKIPGWDWLNEIALQLSKTKKDDESEDETSKTKSISPKPDYLADVIGGRPVCAHPMRSSGFRLRYGRSRNTGLAGVGVHPATMIIVNEFLAPGTHIRTERPGKGSIVAPVDTVEGPIVLLDDGSVLQVSSVDQAENVRERVQKILFLGDILIALGEFLENNHPLVPSGYCEEWWSHDLDRAIADVLPQDLRARLKKCKLAPNEVQNLIKSPLTYWPTAEQAVLLSKEFRIPLHPRYLYRWMVLSPEEATNLRSWILKEASTTSISGMPRITLPYSDEFKPLLERIGIPHTLDDEQTTIILSDPPVSILAQLGRKSARPRGETSLEILSSVAQVPLRDKLGISIGARMGRPEKAEERRMRPPVQVLFPVGRDFGGERNIERVAEGTIRESSLSEDGTHDVHSFDINRGVSVEMVTRRCPKCNLETFESRCPTCGTHTEILRYCSQEGCGLPIDETTGKCPRSHDINFIKYTKTYTIDIRALLQRIKQEIDEPQSYNVRGVLGLTSSYKIPEYLGKGILRAKHSVYCYRDGTARFDATDAPLTHFIPREIGVSIGKLHELGYHTDYLGFPLASDEQVVELKVQDIVVPENCADYLVRVGQFVDDCLEKIYGLERYYNFTVPDDVVGQLVIGLAPHTSAGIIGRIIGFTSASVCYAHPYWHAAKRRNCDGDEDAVILVLDALLNFSKSFLPAGRGGFMDAPLVLSVVLNPEEVDDESHNMEVCSRYPAEFYDKVAEGRHPKEVEHLVDIIAGRLDSEAQYEGFAFTHGTSSFDAGPKNTRYKTLGSMIEKLDAQLNLARTICAVDARDVAERVLSHHFIRDIRGNLRAYSTQRIQCLKCHRVYRRIPLSGTCVCGAKLSLTVRQKNISKYLDVAKKMIADYDLSPYLKERIRLIEVSLDSIFYSEQTALTDFLE